MPIFFFISSVSLQMIRSRPASVSENVLPVVSFGMAASKGSPFLIQPAYKQDNRLGCGWPKLLK
jgi:hypothetical protein